MPQAPKLVVADASVVLKWQLEDEEHVSQAITLREDFYVRGLIRVIAPHLMVYEVVNGIATAARRKRIASGIAMEVLRNLMSLGIESRPVDALRMMEVALNYQLAAYDAAYLALAESEGCELWTGDKPFYEAVSAKLPWVRWIGDYTT